MILIFPKGFITELEPGTPADKGMRAALKSTASSPIRLDQLVAPVMSSPIRPGKVLWQREPEPIPPLADALRDRRRRRARSRGLDAAVGVFGAAGGPTADSQMAESQASSESLSGSPSPASANGSCTHRCPRPRPSSPRGHVVRGGQLEGSLSRCWPGRSGSVARSVLNNTDCPITVTPGPLVGPPPPEVTRGDDGQATLLEVTAPRTLTRGW